MNHTQWDYWRFILEGESVQEKPTFQLVLNIATLLKQVIQPTEDSTCLALQAGGGLFHLPVGPVAQDPVGLLPLPPLPTPLPISQPQNHQSSARASSEGPRQPPRSGQAQGPGLQRRRWGPGDCWVDLDRLVLLWHRHMLQSLQRRSAHRRPLLSSERRAWWAPASPALFHHNFLYPTAGGLPSLAVFWLQCKEAEVCGPPEMG